MDSSPRGDNSHKPTFLMYSQIDIKSKIPKGPMISIKGRLAHKSKVCRLTETTLPEPILVGRKTELEELKRFLDLAFKGNGTTVFISGKAGSGKTRLITEFLKIVKEREIDDLIAGSNKQISAFLQIGKETGARAGEIFNLTWIDIDLQNKTINITPEKGSNPRILKISNKLISMLSSFPNKETKIFTNYKSLNTLRRTFERYRQRTAHKLGNPRIQKITFHTLRHWKATTEYHRTKDILHVMKLLGHRNIKNTLLYTQLIKQEENEEYISKVAKTIDEGRIFIEAGFEYVCEIQGAKLFRKRK